MEIPFNFSLSNILNSLSVLAECGLEVEEMQASPCAFGLLLETLAVMSPVGVAKCNESCQITLHHRGQSVRITMKPVRQFSLELPPKVPMPGG